MKYKVVHRNVLQNTLITKIPFAKKFFKQLLLLKNVPLKQLKKLASFFVNQELKDVGINVKKIHVVNLLIF